MTVYLVEAEICDDTLLICQPLQWVPSTDLPRSGSWFGLQANSAEFWDVITAFAVLMATVWAVKAILKYVRK